MGAVNPTRRRGVNHSPNVIFRPVFYICVLQVFVEWEHTSVRSGVDTTGASRQGFAA